MDLGKFSEFFVLLSWIYIHSILLHSRQTGGKGFLHRLWPNMAGEVHECSPGMRFDFNRKALPFRFMQKGCWPKRTWAVMSFASADNILSPRKMLFIYFLYIYICHKTRVLTYILYSSWAKAKTTICVWSRNVARQEGFKWRRFLRWLITSWKWRRTLKRRCRSHRCNPNVSCPYAETFLHQIICGHL